MTGAALRHLVQCVVEPSTDPLPTVQLENVESGTARLTGNLETLPPAGQNRFRPGDVLFSKLRPYLAKSLLVTDDLQGSGEFLCLRASHDLDGRYLTFLSLSRAWLDHAMMAAYGTKMPRTSWDNMAGFRVPELGIDQQRRIADFLDDRVTRIDRIIAARREQIELLRGLSKGHVDQSLSERGPTRRLRYLCSPIDDRADGAQLPLLAVSIHHGVVPREQLSTDRPQADDLSNYKIVRTGDLVLNRMRAFQGGVGVSRTDGLASPDYLVLRPDGQVSSEWLDRVFRSSWFVGQMTSRLRGIGSAELGSVRTPRVNWADLAQIRLTVPPRADQDGLIDRIGAVESDVAQISGGAGRSIDVLTEYKSALITAAVTGELDVSTAGSGVPA